MFRPYFFVLIASIIMVHSASATVWQVNVADFAFTPDSLSILQGDTVVWTNTGGFHNVHHACDPSQFGTSPASDPWSYTFVFNLAPGLYPYLCEVHPEMMRGKIVVNRRGRWEVIVQSFSFTPRELTVLQGDTVVWRNISGFHNVHHNATPSLFGNSAGSAPWTYSFVFNLPAAAYPYICQVHPSLMSGAVNVISPAPPASPAALVIAADTGSGVTLNWNPSCNAASYAVYRSPDFSVDPYPVLVGTTADTTLTDTLSSEVGAKYFYLVRSVN